MKSIQAVGTCAVGICLLLGATSAQAAPPVADAGGPYNGEVGIAVTFDGTGSTDPDDDIVSYDWQFDFFGSTGTGPTPTHIYAGTGAYTVILTVTDASGEFGVD